MQDTLVKSQKFLVMQAGQNHPKSQILFDKNSSSRDLFRVVARQL